MPPLRERRSEIPQPQPVLHRSLRAPLQPAGARSCRESCRQLFQTYEWPGNIRELENMIKRIVILQDEELVVREMQRAAAGRGRYAGVRHGRCGGRGAHRPRRRRRSRSRAGGRREPDDDEALRIGGGRGRRDGRPPAPRGWPTSRRRRRSRPSATSSRKRCGRSSGTAAEPPTARRQLQDAAEQDQGMRDQSRNRERERGTGAIVTARRARSGPTRSAARSTRQPRVSRLSAPGDVACREVSVGRTLETRSGLSGLPVDRKVRSRPPRVPRAGGPTK